MLRKPSWSFLFLWWHTAFLFFYFPLLLCHHNSSSSFLLLSTSSQCSQSWVFSILSSRLPAALLGELTSSNSFIYHQTVLITLVCPYPTSHLCSHPILPATSRTHLHKNSFCISQLSPLPEFISEHNFTIFLVIWNQSPRAIHSLQSVDISF